MDFYLDSNQPQSSEERKYFYIAVAVLQHSLEMEERPSTPGDSTKPCACIKEQLHKYKLACSAPNTG